MKLVRQIALHFRQGTSDKVYEVDLCEVDADAFVVNFRYGRRGSALREGSKTVLPVSRARADALFDKLVEEKTRKGYVTQERSEPTPPAGRTPAVLSEPALDPRRATVLRYLRQPGERPASWSLSRIVWRAGELGIRAAAPVLATLLQHDDPHTRYAAIWSLGRVGGAEHTPLLEPLTDGGPAHHRRIALEAVRATADDAARARWQARWRARLPQRLLGALDDEPRFRAELADVLAQRTQGREALFHLLYLLGEPVVDRSIIEHLRDLSVAPPNVGVFRVLLKAAVFRRDGRVFGEVARRVALERAFYTSYAWNGSVWHEGQRLDVKAESQRADSRLGYSKGTRIWLRRYLWRVLDRLGDAGDPRYADMAAGLLCAFHDDDFGPPRTSWRGTLVGDGYADAWALNQVLHRNSARHEAVKRALGHRRIGGVVGCTSREEAWPARWDAAPDQLIRVLDASRFAPAHTMAVHALRANPSAWSQVGTQQLRAWIDGPYADTMELGADLAIARFDPAAPDLELVAALCCVRLERVRLTAQSWVRTRPRLYVTDPSFVATVALTGPADSRALLRDLLGTALLTDVQKRATLQAVFHAVLALGGPEDDELDDAGVCSGPVADALRDLGPLLLTAFPRVIPVLPLDDLVGLLQHEHPVVQEFGARLLVATATPAVELPDAILAGLLRSGFPAIRALGLTLFGQLPDPVLLERFAVLVHLVANPHGDVRHAVGPIITRLAPAHPAFARSLFESLLPILEAPEPFEGLHVSLVSTVRDTLEPHLGKLSASVVVRLTRSPTAAVAELGGDLLAGCADAGSLPLRQLAELGGHEVVSIRRAAWTLYAADPDRVRANLDDALRILDAPWEDTRAWAFAWFEEILREDELSVPLLLSMCDGVRPDVQAFGRRMLTLHFDPTQGSRTLEMLAEHPAADMQLFTTNYLERYAAGHPERVARLAPFFTTVLTRVNTGAVAKARVHAFLAEEALRSEESASAIVSVLSNVSATCSVQDRAAALVTLVRVAARWPSVRTPLTVHPPRRRGEHAV